MPKGSGPLHLNRRDEDSLPVGLEQCGQIESSVGGVFRDGSDSVGLGVPLDKDLEDAGADSVEESLFLGSIWAHPSTQVSLVVSGK